MCAGLLIVAWAINGPIFHFSDFWQLVINTGTTIVTFLMVFLIQNTQNRDARAINLKLDELIRAIDKARDQMINIEKLSDAELDMLQAQFEKIRAAGVRRAEQKVAHVRTELPVRPDRPDCLIWGKGLHTTCDPARVPRESPLPRGPARDDLP